MEEKHLGELNELYLSHIGEVGAAFVISSKTLDPSVLTLHTQIQPTLSARNGDEARDYKRHVLSTPHDEGFWRVSSNEKVFSKDVNDHCIYLLDLLLPHEDIILRTLRDVVGEACFDILWESSYLYAGTGPVLSKEVIDGVSRLNASIGFDIYQIDE